MTANCLATCDDASCRESGCMADQAANAMPGMRNRNEKVVRFPFDGGPTKLSEGPSEIAALREAIRDELARLGACLVRLKSLVQEKN